MLIVGNTNKLVGKWVAQITEFAHEAEDLIQRYLYHVPLRQDSGIWNTIKWFSNLLCACHAYKLHCVGSEIDDLIIKIAELNSRLKRYGVKLNIPTENKVDYAMMRGRRRTFYSYVEEFVGLDEDVAQVVEMLMRTEGKVVGIREVAGLSKSTLAWKVFLHKDITTHFRNNRVWVYISRKFSARNVFEEILSGISVFGTDEDNGKNVEDLKDEESVEKIHVLLQKKECFVVLDDIWTSTCWDALKPALGSIESSRSKILLTTRNRGLLQHVDSNGYCHSLGPLDEDDSWELFQLKAFPRWMREEIGDAKEKDKMEELGREMLRYCHGLPLPIVVLGGVLSTKRTSHEWEEVKNIVSATDMWDDSEPNEIFRVLELSYYELPFYLKPCFLYRLVFQKVMRFQLRDYIVYGKLKEFYKFQGEMMKTKQAWLIR